MNERPVRPALFDLPPEDSPASVTSPAPAPAPTVEVPESTPAPEPAIVRPALLDIPEGVPIGRIDHGWAPEPLQIGDVLPKAPGWIAGGLGVLIVAWLTMSMLGFVQDSFARSAATGWLTLLLFGSGVLAVAWGGWLEVKAFRRLLHVEALRRALASDDGPVAAARVLTLEWLDSLSERLPDLVGVRRAVAAAADVTLLRAALRHHLAEQLQQATRRAGDRAALEGGMLVAISPSSALDGMLAGWRGLLLIRQVAAIHGMRPGAAVTFSLIRRVAWTAAGASGVDMLSQSLADSALSQLPVVKHVAAALPGAGLTALRLRRLADVTAMACSPLEQG